MCEVVQETASAKAEREDEAKKKKKKKKKNDGIQEPNTVAGGRVAPVERHCLKFAETLPIYDCFISQFNENLGREENLFRLHEHDFLYLSRDWNENIFEYYDDDVYDSFAGKGEELFENYPSQEQPRSPLSTQSVSAKPARKILSMSKATRRVDGVPGATIDLKMILLNRAKPIFSSEEEKKKYEGRKTDSIFILNENLFNVATTTRAADKALLDSCASENFAPKFLFSRIHYDRPVEVKTADRSLPSMGYKGVLRDNSLGLKGAIFHPSIKRLLVSVHSLR